MSQVITRKSYLRLQGELKNMREVEQLAIRDRISAARDLGDLSENAEYHAAREELSMLMYKVAKLEERLADCRIVDEDEIDASSVRAFTEVTLMDLNLKREVIFKLVEPEQMDFASGRISVGSPIAKGLIGKKIGEVAEIEVPAGVKRYQVLKIDKYFGDA
ncbi:MAG: transcription elongation factor GreA [Candidatus Delongbacteria bacterium]